MYVENVSSVAHNAYDNGVYLAGYTESVSAVARQGLDKANSLEQSLVNITGTVTIDQSTLLNLSLVTWDRFHQQHIVQKTLVITYWDMSRVLV
jgi:hypothetical protein